MRWLVLALIALNAGLYAWNAGWLPRPTAAGGEARPQDRQINPDALRLVPEPAQAPVDAAAPAGVNRPAN
jgi:hypothetical protein